MSRSNARSPHANSEHEMAKLPIIGKSANISTNQQQLGGKNSKSIRRIIWSVVGIWRALTI